MIISDNRINEVKRHTNVVYRISHFEWKLVSGEDRADKKIIYKFILKDKGTDARKDDYGISERRIRIILSQPGFLFGGTEIISSENIEVNSEGQE